VRLIAVPITITVTVWRAFSATGRISCVALACAERPRQTAAPAWTPAGHGEVYRRMYACVPRATQCEARHGYSVLSPEREKKVVAILRGVASSVTPRIQEDKHGMARKGIIREDALAEGKERPSLTSKRSGRTRRRVDGVRPEANSGKGWTSQGSALAVEKRPDARMTPPASPQSANSARALARHPP
jgi:hypothetical protein